MQVAFDKKRWFGRQSMLIRVMVLSVILFVSIALANIVADYLFGDTLFIYKSNKEIAKFLITKYLFSVMISFFILFGARNNRNKNQN